MISLTINGKPVELEQPTPLMSYLEHLGVNARTVAVEHNGEIIARASFTRASFTRGPFHPVLVHPGPLSPGPRSVDLVHFGQGP